MAEKLLSREHKPLTWRYYRCSGCGRTVDVAVEMVRLPICTRCNRSMVQVSEADLANETTKHSLRRGEHERQDLEAG